MPKMTYLNIKKTFFHKDIAISQQEILQGNHAPLFLPRGREKFNGHPGFDHLPDIYSYSLGYTKMEL